ncbi:MAG: LysR family transcriptional regulator [Hyphomicrobium sp.]
MRELAKEVNWDHARIVLEVAREGQFLAAGRRLGLDHATVARRVSALEEAIGAKLFDRSPAGVTLTDAGRRIVAAATEMESAWLRGRPDLDASEAEIKGTVRIGAPDVFGTVVLAANLSALIASHPMLTLQLVPVPRTFSLARRDADIAITVDRPSEGRLMVRRLAGYTLSLYASAHYLETAPPLAGLADLARHRLITYVPELAYSATLDAVKETGIAPAATFQCASALGQLEAARTGAGVALLHDYAIAADHGLVLVVPEFRVARDYWMVIHEDLAEARRIRIVVDGIAEIVAHQARRFIR